MMNNHTDYNASNNTFSSTVSGFTSSASAASSTLSSSTGGSSSVSSTSTSTNSTPSSSVVSSSSSSASDSVVTTEKEKKKTNKKIEFEKTRSEVHPIIEELLEHKIPVSLLVDGYAIGGFYAQNETGYCEVYEQEDNTLVGINTQGKPFKIETLRDLVLANGRAYEVYKRSHQYNLYESAWFKLLMEEFSITSNLVEKD